MYIPFLFLLEMKMSKITRVKMTTINREKITETGKEGTITMRVVRKRSSYQWFQTAR